MSIIHLSLEDTSFPFSILITKPSQGSGSETRWRQAEILIVQPHNLPILLSQEKMLTSSTLSTSKRTHLFLETGAEVGEAAREGVL